MTVWQNYWEVLVLFLIPVGGGIPGGVLLARERGIGWPMMEVLYFISDVVLACVFEPILLALVAAGRRSPFFARLKEAFKKSMRMTTSLYGTDLGPLSLILIAFGVDPMTGRVVARSVGHGFLAGWSFAIAGDMIYFSVLMISTLWLDSVLGDSTKTITIILVLMFVVPAVIRKIRERGRGERV